MTARRGRKKRHRRGQPFLYRVLSVLGRHYSIAVDGSKYVAGSYGYNITIERYKNPWDGPREEAVVLLPTSIVARYRPFNFIVRENNIYFVPPRFYPWPNRGLYVLGGIISKRDTKIENNTLRIRPRIVVAYLNKPVHYIFFGTRSELEEYAHEMLVKTAYDLEPVKTSIATLNRLFMLRRIRTYNVNINTNDNIAIMYMLVSIDEAGQARLAGITMVKVGPYPGSRLVGVIADRQAPYATLRLVAAGFTLDELSSMFHGILDLDDILIDLSISGQNINRLRKEAWALRILKALRNSKYVLRFSDLRDYKVQIGSSSGMYFNVEGISINDLGEAYEVGHLLRAIDLVATLHTFTETIRGRSSTLVKAHLSPSNGSIAVDYVDGVDAILRFASFMLTYRSNFVVPQLVYPHAYMDIAISSSKALRFRLENIDEKVLTAVAFTASAKNPEFADIMALRLALQKHFYPPGLQGSAPLPCISKRSEELHGYVNFLDLGLLLARKILCTHTTSVKDKKRLGCNQINNYYARIENILKLAEALRNGDLEEIRNRISECRAKSFLRYSLAWSLAYAILKGLAQVQGGALLDSVILACRRTGQDCDSDCEVLVVEAGEQGLGFIDAIKADPNLLLKAASVTKKIIDQCNPANMMKRKQSTINTLAKTHSEVQELDKCFYEFLDELKRININRPSIDIARVAFHKYLELCSDPKYQHLCSPACVWTARKIISRESQASEFLRSLLPEIYGAYIPSCWDGCLICIHVSQRVLASGLTNHEQMIYVSKTLAHILLSALLTGKGGGKQ